MGRSEVSSRSTSLPRYASLNNKRTCAANWLGPVHIKIVEARVGNAVRRESKYFGGPPKIPHVIVRFLTDQNTLIPRVANSRRGHDLLHQSITSGDGRTIPETRFASVASNYYTHLDVQYFSCAS